MLTRSLLCSHLRFFFNFSAAWKSVGLLLVSLALPLTAQAQTATLLVLGDSLSAEYGIARDAGWVQLLSQRLEVEKRPWRVVNASISGDTTSGGLQRLPALLDQHRPRLVLIELGANDALRGLSLDMTEKNLTRMIELARQHKAQVVLAGMQIPPNYGKVYTQRFFGLFEQLSKQHKTLLIPFLLDGLAQDSTHFQADRLHPNEAAQALIANNVWSTLDSHLR
ncbi:MAG: arylesterase [Pigmentiphaga sp.]